MMEVESPFSLVGLLVEVVDATGVEHRRPTLDSVNFVIFGEK